MITVVINTIEEQKDWRLDRLFGTTYSRDDLIWIDSGLQQIPDLADHIDKEISLLCENGNTDIQLITVLDCGIFRYGDYRQFLGIYEGLIKLYINENLVCKFKTAKVCECTIVLAHNAVLQFILHKMDRYDTESERLAAEAQKKAEAEAEGYAGGSDDAGRVPDISTYLGIAIGADDVNERNHKNYSFRTEFKSPIGTYLTILPPGNPICEGVSKASAGYKESIVIDTRHIIESVPELITVKKVKYEADKRDNLYFGIFEYIDKSVNDPDGKYEPICPDKKVIQKAIQSAYDKYTYFSDEKNYKTEYIAFDSFESRLDDAKKTFPDDYGDGAEDEDKKSKITIDDYITIIKNRYDKKQVIKENEEIRSSVTGLYFSWRDKNDRSARNASYDAEEPVDVDTADEIYRRKKAEYEDRRAELFKQIIHTRIEIEDYEDVRNSLNGISKRYETLKRKQKKYLLTFIGAAVSVLLMFIPYPVFFSAAGIKNADFLPVYGVSLAVIAAIYLISVMIYAARMRKEKRNILKELSKLDEDSSAKRKKSIETLKKYYLETMPTAEVLLLWWYDICQAREQNIRLGHVRSIHIKRFAELAEYTAALADALKVDIRKNNPDDDTDEEDEESDERTVTYDLAISSREEPNKGYYDFFGKGVYEK